jgi:hypothetical protein
MAVMKYYVIMTGMDDGYCWIEGGDLVKDGAVLKNDVL